MRKLFCFFCAVSLLLTCTACAVTPQRVQAEELLANVRAVEPQQKEPDEDFVKSQYAFGLALLKSSGSQGESRLVSPISAEYALAMAANGAAGETLKQLEKAMGGYSIGDLNRYLCSTANWMPSSDSVKCNLANSIWFRDSRDFTPDPDFLSLCAGYYKASLYKTVFDQQAVDEINGWVRKNTDNMIPSILEKIGPNDKMYLLNALAFNGTWAEKYKSTDVKPRNFTPEDAPAHTVSLMFGSEDYYYESEHCTGFRKDYKEGYSFIALLPEEGLSMEDFLAVLDADTLTDILNTQVYGADLVQAAMPKFSYDFDFSLTEGLQSLGVTDAFGPKADFSRMSNEDLYISGALQKTHIEVDEEGTRAAAATGIIMETKAAPMVQKEVILNRPFLYIIRSCYAGQPLFLGVVADVQAAE